MSMCSRRAKVVVVIILVIYVISQFVSFNDSPNNQPKYDAKHLQLLRDYKARRTKKSNLVIVDSPGASRLAQILKGKHFTTDLPQFELSRTNLSVDMPVRTSAATSLSDIFIAVKTTGKFHKNRLPLLLDTWIPFARQSTFLITDIDDPSISDQFEPGHYRKSTCSNSHHRLGLVCKVSIAYDLFMQTPRRWFCVADDDTYINVFNLLATLRGYDFTKDWYIGRPSLKYPIRVNIDNMKQSFWFHTGGAGYCISQGLALKMAPYTIGGKLRELADRIRVPDDVAVGYIINKKLNVKITTLSTFHSHLEGLWRINPFELKDQITLSYGEFESGANSVITNVVNTGRVIPTYPPPVDPTRLRSVHCYLYPDARECAKFGVASL